MNMKKRLLMHALLAACTTVLFTGCGKSSDHQHQWSEITCKEPKTCKICGLTEGEPSSSHKWIEATCTKPATCSVCGLTKDAPLGHEEDDWYEEVIATLSEDGERVLRCKYCDEKLDTEKTVKYIEAGDSGFNFDLDEMVDYLEAGNFCDLSDRESYKTKELALDTFSIPENETGIREVDIVTKDGKLISVLIEIKSEDQENYKKVLSYLSEKMPAGTVTEIGDDLCADEELLSFSKDSSVALDTEYDNTFFICLSCQDATLTNSIETVDSILRIPLYIDLEFQSNLFLSRYGVDVSLNEETLCSLEHGEDFSTLLLLPMGEYTLRCTGTGEDSVENSKRFTITEPTTVECEIQTHSNEIEFRNFEVISSVNKTPIEVPDVTGKSFSVAKEILEECGFVYISADIDESLYDDDTYIVKKQKPADGKKCLYNERITLKCEQFSEEEAALSGVSASEGDGTTNTTAYEKAFVKEGPSYSTYYLFDTDTSTVINFYTDDTSVMQGTFSGNFKEGVTITWTDYGYTESITEYEDGTATLIDGNGFDWEFEVCDVAEVWGRFLDVAEIP